MRRLSATLAFLSLLSLAPALVPGAEWGPATAAAVLLEDPLAGGPEGQQSRQALLDPDSPEMKRRAPARFDVRLDTTRGDIVIRVERAWAPLAADRFYNLVAAGYYDDSRFFRVIQGRWVQFGINGDPAVSKAWRGRTFPDEPRLQTNARGTVAFAFAVPNGRTTQVFINLRDNAETHDKEPFVPFGRVVGGMEAADALYAEYAERSGGGIRRGEQGPLFEEGNAYLDRNYPQLDRIRRATIEGLAK